MTGIALFGAGRIGKVHAASVTAQAGAELVWVCDPFLDPATELAHAHGALATSEVDEVLADDSVEAVVIGSPTATHVDLIARSVAAGKAVLCEKPIDLDLAAVDRCWDEIAGAAPVVMIGFNRRFDPTFAEIRSRVAAGEIGRLEQLIITSRDPEPPPASYVAGSGGLFRDMTIHDFDMARFFLGEVVSVHASGANLISEEIRAAGDIDSAVVVLRGVDGTLATITNSRRCSFGYDQRLEAFGSTSMLTASNLLPTSVRSYGADHTEAANPYETFFLQRYTAAYRAELAHFLEAVTTGTAPSPSFADGRAALVLADAAAESVRTGAVVEL